MHHWLKEAQSLGDFLHFRADDPTLGNIDSIGLLELFNVEVAPLIQRYWSDRKQRVSDMTDTIGSQLSNTLSHGLFKFIIAFLPSLVCPDKRINLDPGRTQNHGLDARRIGSIHTGPGLLQTLVDGVKLLMKEDIHAALTDKHFLASPSSFWLPSLQLLL